MIMNYYYINVILKMMILIIGRTLFKKIQDVYLSRFCYNNTTTIEEKFLFLKKKKITFLLNATQHAKHSYNPSFSLN